MTKLVKPRVVAHNPVSFLSCTESLQPRRRLRALTSGKSSDLRGRAYGIAILPCQGVIVRQARSKTYLFSNSTQRTFSFLPEKTSGDLCYFLRGITVFAGSLYQLKMQYVYNDFVTVQIIHNLFMLISNKVKDRGLYSSLMVC